MLSPQEVKQKAEKWWNDGSFLTAWLNNEDFFPKEITQIGLVKPSETLANFDKIQKEQEALKNQSKNERGFGYQLVWQYVNSQRTGNSGFITKIYFENAEDFLKFIGKNKDFEVFVKNNLLITSQFPTLKDWILRKPEKVIQNATKWDELLNVCDYFYNNPKPNLYIRQLPIPNLHTKFIENNDSIITSLLNHLLPAEAIDKDTKGFKKRFGLLEPEPLIRFRILDESLYINGLSDISLPIGQFETLFNQQNIENIFIAENQMCILTFPKIPKSIIIFGSGQAVINLSKISWIYGKKVFYWGDLDVEGLGILSNLRSFKADPVVLMMDWECYSKFSEICLCEGKNSVKNIPPNLTEEEVSLFEHLKSLPKERCRFEQERIPVWYVEYCIYSILQKLGIPQTISPP